MAVTINWNTQVITVPISFMTLISGGGGSGSLYELDVNAFRLALKDIEDGDGMPFLDTHRHNGEVVLAGVTYARSMEVINGYTVTFEELGGGAYYTVRCVGANHNIADVLNFNSVNLIIGNAAGLIVAGSGLSAAQATQLSEVWKDMGLDAANVKTITENTVGTDYTEAVGAGIVKDVVKSGAVTTVTRQ